MRYFIADTHFGARFLFKGLHQRDPATGDVFESTERRDAALLEAINDTVQPADELFVLGDFADKKPGKYRTMINCKHVTLILGNHDRVQASENVFGNCPLMKTIKLRKNGNYIKCILCHYPLAFWDGSHGGTAHLYGHVHGQRESTLDAGLGVSRRSMDVTVDNLYNIAGNYNPVSEEDLYTAFDFVEGHDHRQYYEKLKRLRQLKLENEREMGEFND